MGDNWKIIIEPLTPNENDAERLDIRIVPAPALATIMSVARNGVELSIERILLDFRSQTIVATVDEPRLKLVE